jgi:acyl-CoA synthetase (AMP-forming)/AMP-acid ligase II
LCCHVREDETKEKYICAFVASENDGPDIGTIKAGLGRKLPEYMLPAYIMKIDSIPLNSNGKLDV